jgi:hypothetical protein
MYLCPLCCPGNKKELPCGYELETMIPANVQKIYKAMVSGKKDTGPASHIFDCLVIIPNCESFTNMHQLF